MLLGLLHAKETWMSSGPVGLWLLYPFFLLTLLVNKEVTLLVYNFDSEDGNLTGCQNVSHCQKQSCSGLDAPRQPYSTFGLFVFTSIFSG